MLIGTCRVDLTVWEPGVEMLGWGQPEGRLEGVDMPIHARAVVVEQDGRTIAMVCVELCFISHSIREGVLDALAEHPELGIDESGLMLTATHTHSGPGGFPHRLLYLITNRGHVPAIYRGLVDGIVQSIRGAHANLTPGCVSLHQQGVPVTEPIAFNRAMTSYRRNPDSDTEERAAAVDRRMRVLRFTSDDGRDLGAWSWFGVHCTSLHYDHRKIHPDNKGIASASLEAEHDADYVGVFAQGSAGDVSPNYRYDRQRGFFVGRHDRDTESADFNGSVQHHYASKALSAAGQQLTGTIDARLHYVDFNGLAVDEAYAGRSGRRTARARLGLAFIEGTGDGPGPLWKARWVRRGLSRGLGAYKRLRPEGSADPYGRSFPFLEVGIGGSGRCFGAFAMGRPWLPGAADPVVGEVKRLLDRHADLESPWLPSIVPLQILRIGELAIVALPNEPTTMAGRRIEAQVKRRLPGVQHVVIQGYSNAYHGYLTTRQEYAEQRYEGAHTVYGQWTMAGTQTSLDGIAAQLRVPIADRSASIGQPPARVSTDELKRRAFTEPPPRRRW